MENRITVNICGEEYTFIAQESPTYMQKVAALVDEHLSAILAGGRVNRHDAAVLAAVNIADEYLKYQRSGENLRSQLKAALDDVSRVQTECAELRRELVRLRQRPDQG